MVVHHDELKGLSKRGTAVSVDEPLSSVKLRTGNISKSEKMSAGRADAASTAHKRAAARHCSIWAIGWHLDAILVDSRILGDRIVSPYLPS